MTRRGIFLGSAGETFLQWSEELDLTADQDPTKDRPIAPATEENEELIPLETLDRLIADQDPDFRESMAAVAAESAGQDANIELLDLDQLLAEHEAKSFRARLRRTYRKALTFLIGLRTTLIHFFTDEFPTFLRSLAARIKSGVATLREAWRQFGFKPLRFRLMVFGFAGLCAASVTIIWFLVSRGLPEPDRLFMQSIEELAESAVEYDPATQQEAFYDSVRAAQNVLIIPKLVVNLKRSAGSGANPMMAADFYVEGNSPDVVIEIKARETEFRDAFARSLEEFNADELDTAGGKTRMLERLAREANRLATKGRVRKVLLKTFVLKP